MKTLISGLALVTASPALAQAAPAQPHQGHAQHQGQGQDARHQQHGQGPMQHGQHQPGQQGCGCCADRNGDGRMDCCERMQGDRGSGQPAQPGGHQSH